MKRFSEQFKSQADRISMRAAEQRELRERVTAYMEYHPLPAALKASTKTSAPLLTESYRVFKINMLQVRSTLAMCAVMVAIVVPFAAEQTLPGDVLYPVKVSFNEEVRSSITFSPYEKVEWETTRLERRLAEARLLASEGKLTDEVQADVAQAVKQHTEAAQKELALLEIDDSEEAAIAQIALASSIDAQTEAFAQAVEKTGATASSTTVVTDALATAKVATTHSSTTPSYERMLAKVESETTRAYELLESLEIDNDIIESDIARRLDDVNRKLRRAIALVEVPEAATEETASSTEPAAPELAKKVIATGLLKEALQTTQKLIIYMTDIELASSVSVEELVPVELTETERLRELKYNLTRLTPRIAALKAERNLSQKATAALTKLDELVAAATAVIAGEGEVEAGENAYTTLENIIVDIEDNLVESDEENEELPIELPVVATTTATTTPPVVEEVATSTATSSTPVVEEGEAAE